MATTPTLLTNARFELMPDYPGKQELLEGELISLPPAKRTQASIATALYTILRASGGYRIFIEAGYQLTPETWLVPDVSVEWPGQRVENDYAQGAPMIAVEIVSRSNVAEEIDAETAALPCAWRGGSLDGLPAHALHDGPQAGDCREDQRYVCHRFDSGCFQVI
jgi:Uma2 family endonuclease